jgi:hypothetical protein
MSSDNCENKITVSHDDPKVIERIIEAHERDRLFDEFLPCPVELLETDSFARDEKIAEKMLKKYGARDQYDWCCQNWGRDWDEDDESDGIILDIISPNKIGLAMCTAWSPPVPFLDRLVDLGCTVCCVFFEPCHWTVGIYKDKMLWQTEGEDIEPAVQGLFAPFEEAQAKGQISDL